MFKSSEKLLVVDKQLNEIDKDGKKYVFYSLFIKDKNGFVEQYSCSKYIYDKAETNKSYCLYLYSGYRNKIEINDIEV